MHSPMREGRFCRTCPALPFVLPVFASAVFIAALPSVTHAQDVAERRAKMRIEEACRRL